MADRRISIEELLRRVAEEGGTAPIPDEETVLAYLSGTANELEIEQVRDAALSSPGFRRDLADLGGVLEKLEGPSAESEFDAARPGPAPALESVGDRGPRVSGSPGWLDRIFALFPRPALAFAALLGLIVAPATWWVLHGDGSALVDPVSGAEVFTLRETPDVSFRGEDELPRKELIIGESTIVFRIRAPRGAEEGTKWDVSLTDVTGATWRREGVATSSVDGKLVLSLGIDPARLAPGDAEIRLSRPDVAAPVLYHFRLRKE